MTGVTVPPASVVHDQGMVAIGIALGVATLLIVSVFCLMARIDAVAARLDRRIDGVRSSPRH